MAGATLREISIPRFALRRDEAAAALAISPSLFDIWVKEKKMPAPRRIGGVVLWDAEAVRAAWSHLCDGEADDGKNPFDGITA